MSNLEKLYEKYVPANVREYIDEKQEEKEKRKPKKKPKKQVEDNNPSRIGE